MCKLKNSDKTKGYYKKTAKLFDAFLRTKISYKECEDFQTELFSHKKLNPKTVNNYASYAKRLFDYAMKLGLLEQNHFRLLTSFKISKKDRAPKDNFTHDEFKLISGTKNNKFRNFILLPCTQSLELAKYGAWN
ncbi:phage integrase SAM-like domain-containing protein [Campylobacter geochelonis]|uniref:phage integrase SAM-like domain-containing protein n=1 Tax=Campylobacter geochelonis TaxID=1780362 RepID=UPI00094DA4C0|nr:phage integrase SAM-like domain-containing protein [Campylobacter geochelonis]